MESTDVCSLDEFKDTDECKKKSGFFGNIGSDFFWAMVLIAISFFTTTWSNLFNSLLTWIYSFFGKVTTNFELWVSAGLSLTILLILTQLFEVNIEQK